MTKNPVAKKVVAKNKKAFADFEILDQIEAGIVLTGSEIKSVRSGQINLKGSHVEIYLAGSATAIKKHRSSAPTPKPPAPEAFAENIHISPYKHSHEKPLDPKRKRKLLLHRKEIQKLESQRKEKGFTIVPLEIYLKKGRAKLLIGLARGKKKYDKRTELKKKAQNLEIRRALRLK